jgi:hypothetical protein
MKLLSNLPESVKRFISRFTDRPIEAGYGVSFDESFKILEKVSDEKVEATLASTKCIYKLKSNIGGFEMVGIIRGRSGLLYQIRHILTGETINISKKMLDLLLEKEQNG